MRYSFEFLERFDGYKDTLTELEAASQEGPKPASSAGTSQTVTHSVVGGDTLWGIARRYNVTLEALLAAGEGDFVRIHHTPENRTALLVSGKAGGFRQYVRHSLVVQASVFYSDGPGLLIHPLWQISNAYFTSSGQYPSAAA